MKEYQLFINDQFCDAASGARFSSLNPFSQETVATCGQAGADDVDRAVRAARTAFDDGPWPRLSGEERARIIKNIADGIAAQAGTLTELEVADSGSTIKKAKEDIYLSGRNLANFAKLALLPTEESLEGVGKPGFSRNTLLREPIGVVGAIIPWNFPLKMAVWKLGPALAAGNTIVLKPSEETPATAMELARIVHEAGVPPGVVNIVTGFGPEAGAALASHPLVDKIAFTGSTAVGQFIMCAAAVNLKNVTLECGGKSANIVLDDADLSMAIDGALYAMFYHQGQCCEAGSRLFLPERIAGDFLEGMLERVRRMCVGDPMNPSTDIGPLVSKKQQDKVLGYIERARSAGTSLLCGGKAPASDECSRGFFVEPTIFDNVDNRSPLAQDEIFGPVLSVIRYANVEEAMGKANDSRFGLAAGVWSRDIERARIIASKLRAGTVWINEWHLLSERAPFGGYKQSGVGREFGIDGLNEYRESKHLHIDEVADRAKKPWYDTVVPKM